MSKTHVDDDWDYNYDEITMVIKTGKIKREILAIKMDEGGKKGEKDHNISTSKNIQFLQCRS